MSRSNPKDIRRPGQSTADAIFRTARRRAAAAAARPASSARRDFLKGASAAGAVAGLPLVATSASAQGALRDGGPKISVDLDPDLRRGNNPRVTLFFNFTHLAGAEAATDHYLYIAGRKHKLGRVADAPEVLAKHRRSNALLRFVNAGQITHHAVDIAVPANQVLLAYLTCNEDDGAGTWEMTGTFFHVHAPSLERAYREARELAPTGPLPLSGKRRRYGAPAAMSLKDFLDEGALVDTVSFAEALVGVHPAILSMEPESFGVISKHYVGRDADTFALGQSLSSMGPAVVAGKANVAGKPSWATLKPLIDQSTGQPYKKSDGKLNQYQPEWSAAIGLHSRPAVAAIHPRIRNDASLGLDVTPFNLNNDKTRPQPAQTTGKLWAMHDGKATVERSALTGGDSGPKFVFKSEFAETGLVVTKPTIYTLADGRPQITLDNVSNWFLRWLGVYVQFYDANGKVIPVGKLPADTVPAKPGPYPTGLEDAIYLGLVPPALTLLGIPIYPGYFSPVVNMPTNNGANAASSMRILYGGLGLSGSVPPGASREFLVPGALMTGAFNYALVGILMAVGASGADLLMKRVVGIGAPLIAAEISQIVGEFEDGTSFVAGLPRFIETFCTIIYGNLKSPYLAEFIVYLLGLLEANAVIDSIPLVGEVAQALAVATGAIQLAQTYIEIGVSPPVYAFDLVATHDLSVTFIAPANGFPELAGHTMHYVAVYQFDNGTTHTLDDGSPVNPNAATFPIKFTQIPFGGQVNVTIGFYLRKNNAGPDAVHQFLAGSATTGLTSNSVDQVDPPPGKGGFPITAYQVPINSATRYVHSRKTALNAQGEHWWQTDSDGSKAPPYTPPPGSQVPGLGAFESITVRQEAGGQGGYVGYSWGAFSSGVNACGTTGQGQFDQMANLNTDPANAQKGYVTSSCGYDSGVRMGYNLLTHQSLNIYVDTTTLLIRPINLDPPHITPPGTNLAFALLNNDSTRCLLHPSGHLVSIDNANHKIESLKLPPAALPVSVVTQQYLARTYAGMGTQPGLIYSPVALSISPDGVILVLEDGFYNNRIQAFDLGGNPVRYFKNQDSPYFLELPATMNRIYLDLAVEFAGYLYVLSTDSNNVHRLDIYHRLQTGTKPIATTLNLNAAKLTVDYWRRVYALNYEVLRLPNGNIPEFTEPSVSVWLPTLS